MAIKRGPTVARPVHQSTSGPRLAIDVSADTLEELAAWARFEGRSTEAQARFLIEQAVVTHVDRWTLTRR